MNDTVTVTNDTVVDTAVSAPAPAKRKGRKVDPNSKFSRARALLASLPPEKLTHKEAVKELVAQLGVTEGTANVYFYNARKPVASE